MTPALESALEVIGGARRLLVASDYDGTIAPIVQDPARALPDPVAMQALERLADMDSTVVALISGRSLADLMRVVTPDPKILLLGTHGTERSGQVSADRDISEILASLRALTDLHPGLFLDPKPKAVAVHYRAAPEHADLVRETIGRIAAEHGGRTIDGKMVCELVLGQENKGTAVEALRSEFGADAVFFAGDDTTDEDVFAVLEVSDVGVKVGDGESGAKFRIERQADVASILERLAALRSRYLDSLEM